MPTDAIWNGNFAGETDTAGNQYTIYDPLSYRRQRYAGALQRQSDPCGPHFRLLQGLEGCLSRAD
jgi:hypothetical protein